MLNWCLPTDRCLMCGCAYSDWAGAQQRGGARAQWWQQSTRLTSASRLGNSCWEQFVCQVRLLRLGLGATGLFYPLALIKDLVSVAGGLTVFALHQKNSQEVAVKSGERVAAGVVVWQYQGVLVFVLTACQGLLVPKTEEVSSACFSKHPAPFNL